MSTAQYLFHRYRMNGDRVSFYRNNIECLVSCIMKVLFAAGYDMLGVGYLQESFHREDTL